MNGIRPFSLFRFQSPKLLCIIGRLVWTQSATVGGVSEGEASPSELPYTAHRFAGESSQLFRRYHSEPSAFCALYLAQTLDDANQAIALLQVLDLEEFLGNLVIVSIDDSTNQRL